MGSPLGELSKHSLHRDDREQIDLAFEQGGRSDDLQWL